MNKKTFLIASALSLTLFMGYKFRDEGMFPLSEIHQLDLKKAGLKIDQNEIYNPNSPSLIDALVNVGGCTGSFVSEDGLIITNHHCAFDAVKLASTTQNDYLNKGFIAQTKELEIEAKGLTCRITESYEDVSDKILGAVSSITNPADRLKGINEAMKKLAADAELEDPSIQAEVSEMFIGKTYVLFKYKIIQDVRLVYIPSRNIGEFGGETDNWVWPRHTGDFSFMRAYVAKDGTAAKYNKDNVPYKPKKFLKVNPKGTNEEDFVFILGYPGRTFRHRPAAYIQYQQNYLLPYTSELYSYQNDVMEKLGNQDPKVALKLATRIKRNANVMKNYRGKLEGLKNINLIDTKIQEDNNLAQFIKENDTLQAFYGSLISDINNTYNLINSDAHRDMWFSQIYSASSLLTVARNINNFKTALISTPENQKQAFFDQNFPRLKSILGSNFESYNLEADKRILKKMLSDASKFKINEKVDAVNRITSRGNDPEELINNFVEEIYKFSRLKDEQFVYRYFSSPKNITDYNDGLLIFEKSISKQIADLKPEKDRRDGIINKLMGDYVSVKELYLKKKFIPDANSTLRLTYGYVRGYTANNGEYQKPYTTIKGILEKGATGNPDYSYPSILKTLWNAKDFGDFAKNDLEDVPVGFLYNMDTTGGNSGSPIMNAEGKLIGVNFDRAYGATINDYAWNESYSRSIGVDIRYVLWVAQKVDHANNLLIEMGVN